MNLSLDTVFKEKKFERIVFYLKERGITDSKSLESFDFAELSFVPGVTEDIIDEVQPVIQNILLKQTTTETLPVVSADNMAEFIEIPELNEIEKSSLLQKSTDNTQDVQDASVEQIFAGIPRSAPFIQYCLQNRKLLMSQLHDDDFDVARSLHGLGESSANLLRETYLQFYARKMQHETADLNLGTAADMTVDKLFGNQPHGGLLIRHCRSIGIHTMADLSEFSFSAKEVNGIGANSMQKLKNVYLEKLDQFATDDAQDRVLPNFPDMNRRLKLSTLVIAGLTDSAIAQLSNCGYHIVDDLYTRELSIRNFFALREVFSFLSLPITMHFENKLKSLKDISFDSILQKSKGETLQTIADNYNLTRERVRQIIAKSCRTLLPYAEMVAQAVMYNRDTFESTELQSVFKSADVASCCLFVLCESTQYRYLKFSDKFVDSCCCPQNIEQHLHLFANDIVGDGLNFYDNLEHIEEELPNYNLGFLDFEDIMNYLVQVRYRFYGDYVIKRSAPYSIICYDAILKYFPFDIKLDSDEENCDMGKLRNIIQKRYHGLNLPENNRALTAGITRNVGLLVLSGRGRYCPIEKVIYSPAVMDDIYAFVQNSSQTSFYYNELFAQFQGRLLAETNITNANFLHGMLMHIYPEDFTYERDLLVKSGEIRIDINDRLCELIISNGTAMTKEEIKKAIPGTNDFVIAFSVARLPCLIQWEYNSFNHMDNIHCTNEEIAIIHELVENGLEQYSGYMSEAMLYKAAQIACPQFIEKNHIRSSLNFYFVTAYLLSNDFRFRRPHILSLDFPTEDLSVANIARELLQCKDTLNYSKYTALANNVGWAGGTQYAVFTEMEKDFVRVDDDNYVRRGLFHIDESALLLVASCIESLISDSGYYAISSIFSYKNFPVCDYEWNGFLLSSIIEEYQTGFKIVSPQVRDRRYLRGILLKADDTIDSFEDLVLSQLKKDCIKEISDTDMFKYLKMHGLIIKVMPQELYECEMLPFKNDTFTVK